MSTGTSSRGCNRPYVKQFRYEEQMCVVILLDASTSMSFDGKFERARQMAGCVCADGLFSAWNR